MATIVDSYSESNQSSFFTCDYADAVAQSFTGDGGTLNSCKFYLLKSGTPTGNATAKLFAHDGGTFGVTGKPTGAALATSETFDVSTLTGSYQLITFTFTGANKVTLTNGTKYYIAFSFPSNVNTVRVGDDESSPTHNGCINTLNSSGTTWSASFTSGDLCFYVYKDDPPVSVDVSLSPVSTSTSVPTPTITEGVGTSISLTPLALTATILTMSVAGDANTTLDLINAGSVTVTTPTITEGVGVDTTLSLINAGSVTIPEVDVGIYQRVFLEAIALSTSLYEPTISVERNWGQQGEQETTWTPASAVTTTWTPASNNNTTWTPVVDTLKQS